MTGEGLTCLVQEFPLRFSAIPHPFRSAMDPSESNNQLSSVSATKHGNIFWDLLEVVDPFLWEEESKIDVDFFDKGQGEEQQWADPFVSEYAQAHWAPEEAETPLPAYLMAGGLLSPTPDLDYNAGQFENHHPMNNNNFMMPEDYQVKQEPMSPPHRPVYEKLGARKQREFIFRCFFMDSPILNFLLAFVLVPLTRILLFNRMF